MPVIGGGFPISNRAVIKCPACQFQFEYPTESIQFRPWEPPRFSSEPLEKPVPRDSDIPVAGRFSTWVEILLFALILTQIVVWILVNRMNG
ncbi:hypothetical protein Pla110_43700 [Polystyrenella longa]|uniref:Uncharacterized protein n=1 Tax=Polystyrenella longa TaxID=2528007 RepID=A0A518CTR3_9PLAN|nr:hypothetical protein Pla110_43700 [Polystyrenella longa]